MKERETKKIKVGENELTVLTYITAREARVLYSSIADIIEKNEDGKMSSNDSIKLQDEKIKMIVKEVNGSTENILDKIIDMNVSDFQYLTNYIGEIMGEKKNTKEKNQDI